jgi:hypothetical protein
MARVGRRVGAWVHGCMARVGGWVGAWVHGAEFRTNHTFRGELVDVWRVSHGEVERSYRRPHVLRGRHAIHDAKSNEVMSVVRGRACVQMHRTCLHTWFQRRFRHTTHTPPTVITEWRTWHDTRRRRRVCISIISMNSFDAAQAHSRTRIVMVVRAVQCSAVECKCAPRVRKVAW